MNIAPVTYRNYYQQNTINFKKQIDKEQLAKDLAVQIVSADIVNETIGEINKLLISKEELTSKMQLAKTLSKMAMEPLNEGVDSKVLDYHKTVKEFIENIHNSKLGNKTKRLEKDGVVYSYQNGTMEYPDVVIMRTLDEQGEELHAYAYHNPANGKYDYRFRNFTLTKNFSYGDAIIVDDNLKTLNVQKNFWSPEGFVYSFDENNKPQKAKLILYDVLKSQAGRPAAFKFDENGKIRNIVVAPKADGSGAYYTNKTKLDRFFQKENQEVLCVGTINAEPRDVHKFINF